RDGEHDDLGPRRFGLDLTQRPKAVQDRHRDVQKDQVGMEPTCGFDGCLPIADLADDLVARRLEPTRQTVPHQGVIGGDKDAHRHSSGAARCTVTRVPRPGPEATSSSAPMAAARSRMVSKPKWSSAVAWSGSNPLPSSVIVRTNPASADWGGR